MGWPWGRRPKTSRPPPCHRWAGAGRAGLWATRPQPRGIVPRDGGRRGDMSRELGVRLMHAARRVPNGDRHFPRCSPVLSFVCFWEVEKSADACWRRPSAWGPRLCGGLPGDGDGAQGQTRGRGHRRPLPCTGRGARGLQRAGTGLPRGTRPAAARDTVLRPPLSGVKGSFGPVLRCLRPCGASAQRRPAPSGPRGLASPCASLLTLSA